MRRVVAGLACVAALVACGSFGSSGASSSSGDAGDAGSPPEASSPCSHLFCDGFDTSTTLDVAWSGVDHGPTNTTATLLTPITDGPDTPPRAVRLTIPAGTIYEAWSFQKQFGSLKKKSLRLETGLRLVKPNAAAPANASDTGTAIVAEILVGKVKFDAFLLESVLKGGINDGSDFTEIGEKSVTTGGWHRVGLAVDVTSSPGKFEISLDGERMDETNIPLSVDVEGAEIQIFVGSVYADGVFTETIFDVDTVTFDAQ